MTPRGQILLVLESARHLRQKFAAILPSFPDDTADLSKDLLPGGKDFSSAEDLRDYLLRLLILMTEGRVSPRRPSVLAYISNQLLHSHVVPKRRPRTSLSNSSLISLAPSATKQPGG